MLAVSDTSPIANLALIKHLHLLPEQFSRVCIPRAVEAELADLPDQPASALVRRAREAGWLQVSPLSDTSLPALLSADLHWGESEAIALARELRADRILLDEREARQVAARLGLRVTGVLGILLRAKETGAIPAIQPLIAALRENAGFFVSDDLEQKVLHEAGE